MGSQLHRTCVSLRDGPCRGQSEALQADLDRALQQTMAAGIAARSRPRCRQPSSNPTLPEPPHPAPDELLLVTHLKTCSQA